MHTRTTLALLALVAGACLYLFGPWSRSDAETVAGRRSAFPGLSASSVASIEVDNVRADEQLVLERDGFGEWYLVEPVAWRAAPESVRFLLENLTSLVAEPAPDLTEQAFGALQARIEFEERVGEGQTVEHVLELGQLDLDRTRVAARVDGVLARVARPLLDLSERPIVEYRSKRLLQLDPSSILELERRGELVLAGGGAPDVGPEAPGTATRETFDLGFRAVLEAGVWVAVEPERLRLSPTFLFTGVLNPFALFQVQEFVDDVPQDLREYGLDPPAFELTAHTGSGDALTLAFGYRPADAAAAVFDRRWLCRLEGSDQVFGVSAGAVSLFTKDVRTMADEQAFLLLRDDVVGIELTTGEAGLAFDRSSGGRGTGGRGTGGGDTGGRGSGTWRVGRPGAAPESFEPADAGLTADVLNALLDLSFATWLEPGDVPDGAPRGAVRLSSSQGEEWRLEVGPALTLRGIDGYPVRRAGESLWGFVTEDPLRAALDEPRDYLARQPFELTELQVVAVELEREDQRFRWGREGSSGLWKPAGLDAEDRDFARLVDALLAPRIARWSGADERVELQGPLEVRLTSFDGRRDQSFRLGRAQLDGEPRALFEQGGRQGTLEGDLLGRLEGLLAR